jgi:hypothetical protein
MTVRQIHDQLAWFVVVGNGMAGLWALAAHWLVPLRHAALWWWTAMAHVSIFVQGALGVGILVDEDMEPPEFHVFYGFLAMVAVGIIYSYRQQVAAYRYLLYGWGGLFITGLIIRAMLL